MCTFVCKVHDHSPAHAGGLKVGKCFWIKRELSLHCRGGEGVCLRQSVSPFKSSIMKRLDPCPFEIHINTFELPVFAAVRLHSGFVCFSVCQFHFLLGGVSEYSPCCCGFIQWQTSQQRPPNVLVVRSHARLLPHTHQNKQ